MGWCRPQVPTAQGRFLVSNPMTIPSKVAHDALAKAFPKYKFPEGKDEPSKHVIDNSKARMVITGSAMYPALRYAYPRCPARWCREYRMCHAPGSDLSAALRQVLKELGMQLHPAEETFVDMARTLIALGIAKPVKA